MDRTVLYFILLLLGSVCFVTSAFQVYKTKIDFIGLGLFFWILVPLIQTARQL